MHSLAQSFDLTNEFNILRLICGLFFIPHIYAKFFVPEALGFFKAAKLNPPAVWMYTACVIESFLADRADLRDPAVLCWRDRLCAPALCRLSGAQSDRR